MYSSCTHALYWALTGQLELLLHHISVVTCCMRGQFICTLYHEQLRSVSQGIVTQVCRIGINFLPLKILTV